MNDVLVFLHPFILFQSHQDDGRVIMEGCVQ